MGRTMNCKPPDQSVYPETKRKRRPMTAKQKILVKEVAKGKTYAEAKRRAGYHPNYGGKKAEFLQSAIVRAMVKQGITDSYLAKKIKDGLEAGQFLRDLEGNFIEKPDFNARHKHIDTALKLKNSYPEEKAVPVDTNITIKWEG